MIGEETIPNAKGQRRQQKINIFLMLLVIMMVHFNNSNYFLLIKSLYNLILYQMPEQIHFSLN